HDRPTEVRPERRAAHVAVLALVLTLGSGCCLAPLFMSPKVQHLNLLNKFIQDTETTLLALDKEARASFTVGQNDPDPAVRQEAAVRWQQDQALAEQLRHKLAAFEKERHKVYRVQSWLERLESRWVDSIKASGAAVKKDAPGDIRQHAAELLVVDVRS